jgi:Tfp pilus assembly protein PilO
MEYTVLVAIIVISMIAGFVLSWGKKSDKLLEELADLETLRDKMKVEGYFFTDVLDIQREIDEIKKKLGI